MVNRRFAVRAKLSLAFAALCALALPAAAQAPGAGIPGADELGLPPPPTEYPAEKPVGTSAGPATQDVLLKGPANPAQWLHYGGDYRNFRNSPVKSITPANARGLRVAWSAPTGTLGQFSTSPVVYGGVMYFTTSYNRLMAVDAKTGKFLWRYDVKLQPDMKICCGPANRGVAIGGDYVVMATLDARLIAFDRTTGKVAWDTQMIPYKDGYSSTSAPLIVNSMVFIGFAGGEFGASGLIDGYDLKTGKRLWRTHTVAQPGDPNNKSWAGDSWKSGGSPSWNTGAYDAETNTLFWTTGNPSPDWNGDARAGDNLYSDSVLALDPKTGKMKWYFQFTPHDMWDFDGNTQIFLVDTWYNGKKIKALAQPNRNGFFYLLDRTTGKFLRATQYVEQLDWAKGVDAKGRPIVDPSAYPTDKGSRRVCPSNMGGMNGSWTGAYDPSANLIFVPTVEACQSLTKGIAVYVKGIPYYGGTPTMVDSVQGKGYGTISAIDVATGQVKWRYRDPQPMMAGAVSTAGGVLFSSTVDGEAIALDQKTGERLWSFRMGGSGRGQPIVYEIDGQPYVAVPSGGWAAMGMMTGKYPMAPEGGQLFVFTLDK